MSITLNISDLHTPFEHPNALDFVHDVARQLKPDRVVCLGDEVDMHNFSRWPREPDALGAVEELTAARKTLKQLAKLFPTMTIVDSNHTWRPWKKAAAAGLLSMMMRSRQSILETPDGWRWVEALHHEGYTTIHGEGFAGARAAIDAAKVYHHPVCIGHIHAHAGVTFNTGPTGQVLWGLNSGCLVDPSAIAFRYGKHCKDKPTLGTSAVIHGVPYFFPMATS